MLFQISWTVACLLQDSAYRLLEEYTCRAFEGYHDLCIDLHRTACSLSSIAMGIAALAPCN